MTAQQSRNESNSHPKGATLKASLSRLQRRLEFKLAALKRRVSPESVHDVRTAARRLQALLHGFRAQLSPSAVRRYRHCLKRVTRDLGALRDADVAQQSSAAVMRTAHRTCRNALDSLNVSFARRRHRLAGRLQARMAKAAWSRDMRQLRIAAADTELIRPNDCPFAALIRVLLVHRRRRLRARLRKDTRSEHALHRLRLKVKRLRYFLEEGVNFDAVRGSARELILLKGLQDCLGQLHDLTVLRDYREDGTPCRVANRELRKKCVGRRKRLLGDYDELRVALMHLWDTRSREGRE